MSNVSFKLDRKGVSELMKSGVMQLILREKAAGIKGRCGDGYEQDIHVGRNRANAMVYAKSNKAKRDNSKNNTLLKAVR